MHQEFSGHLADVGCRGEDRRGERRTGSSPSAPSVERGAEAADRGGDPRAWVSVPMVAQRYNLNANQVFRWRRLFRVPERATGTGRLVPVVVGAPPGCCSASPFDPLESKRIKILPRRSASNPRALE